MDGRSLLEKLPCELIGICSGCSYGDVSFSEQLKIKEDRFRQKWKSLQLPLSDLDGFSVDAIAPWGLRDRVDLTIKELSSGQRVVGLYKIGSPDIAPMEKCPQMSSQLQNWFEEFRQNLPPIVLGSVRLRVSPQGEKGAWLDLPHLTVKDLFTERKWLSWLLQRAVVEVGQKRKRLVLQEDQLKLLDPAFEPWFESFVKEEQSLISTPLYSSIASFSQVGVRANRALIEEVMRHLNLSSSENWLELGSGTGNFTLSLASSVKEVVAMEMDRLALEAFEYTLNHNDQNRDLKKKIRIERVNFHRPSLEMKRNIEQVDGIFADPPRSGLKDFLDVLEETVSEGRFPHRFIYVSCFHESLIGDLKRLMSMGYQVSSIKGLDQFPFSQHCEYVVFLERK